MSPQRGGDSKGRGRHPDPGRRDRPAPRAGAPSPGQAITIRWDPGISGSAAKLERRRLHFEVGDVFDFAGLSDRAPEAWVQNRARRRPETIGQARPDRRRSSDGLDRLPNDAMTSVPVHWKAQNVNASASVGRGSITSSVSANEPTRSVGDVPVDGELRDPRRQERSSNRTLTATAPLRARLRLERRARRDGESTSTRARAGCILSLIYGVVHPQKRVALAASPNASPRRRTTRRSSAGCAPGSDAPPEHEPELLRCLRRRPCEAGREHDRFVCSPS